MQFLLPGQKFFFQNLLCRFQIAALDIPTVITVQAQHIKEIADGIGVSVAEHYIDAGDRTRRVEFTRCFRQWREIFPCTLRTGIRFVGNTPHHHAWVVFVTRNQLFNRL
ncbi:hypothetical protein ExPUPEC61_01969 [Escherichia coli]|nr:hypothetical protein ExPUPEC61_01969 [Escherichia coli]